MRIVSHKKLVEFYNSEGHGDAQTPLERWYDIAEQAEWHSLSDIKVDCPTTDYVGNQHYVFNIKGNKYRLIVVVQLFLLLSRLQVKQLRQLFSYAMTMVCLQRTTLLPFLVQ